MVQIRKSTLKIAAGICLGIVLVIALIAVTLHFTAGSSITIKAFVDGTDVVKISGKRLWIEHLTWQQPTRISVDGTPFNPVWSESESPSFPGWTNNTTAPFALNHAFKPGHPEKINITKRVGRGPVTIIEKPTPDNQQTLAIRIDDGALGGADTYEFAVSW